MLDHKTLRHKDLFPSEPHAAAHKAKDINACEEPTHQSVFSLVMLASANTWTASALKQ